MIDASLVPILVLWGLVAAVFVRIGTLEYRLRRLSQLDGKLDALLKHAGIRFDAYSDVPPKVADAVRHDRKIDAIKAYREATGADLRDAKEYVEELQRRTRN
jgi:hypothetical protein